MHASPLTPLPNRHRKNMYPPLRHVGSIWQRNAPQHLPRARPRLQLVYMACIAIRPIPSEKPWVHYLPAIDRQERPPRLAAQLRRRRRAVCVCERYVSEDGLLAQVGGVQEGDGEGGEGTGEGDGLAGADGIVRGGGATVARRDVCDA